MKHLTLLIATLFILSCKTETSQTEKTTGTQVDGRPTSQIEEPSSTQLDRRPASIEETEEIEETFVQGEEIFASWLEEYRGELSIWDRIDAGGSQTCALKLSGRVLCWGRNSYGFLGQGHFNSSSSYPVAILTLDENGEPEPLSDIVQISIQTVHACALTSGGQIKCWGKGSRGRLANGSDTDRAYATLVKKRSGSSAPLSQIIQISMGNQHSCALTSGGQVKCWGKTNSGQLGHGSASAGKKNYPVSVVAEDGSGAPLENIVQISLGQQHSCALDELGQVLCWGDGRNGRLGTGNNQNRGVPTYVVAEEDVTTPLSGIAQISAGESHTCALTIEGEVKCWGKAASGRLGHNSSSDDKNYPVSVVADNGLTTPLSDIVQVSAGHEHTCTLTSDGEVKCWGKALSGRLGHNSSSGDKNYPISVVADNGLTTPLSKIIQVSSGFNHTCALTSDGQVQCWGYGNEGQLGVKSLVHDYPRLVQTEEDPSKVLNLGMGLKGFNCVTSDETFSCQQYYEE